MRRLAILAALALAACDPAPKVVTHIEVVLPAPPSPDLLVIPPPPVTAGSKDMTEVLTRLATAIKERDRQIAGWVFWWRAAEVSAAQANAAKKP